MFTLFPKQIPTPPSHSLHQLLPDLTSPLQDPYWTPNKIYQAIPVPCRPYGASTFQSPEPQPTYQNKYYKTPTRLRARPRRTDKTIRGANRPYQPHSRLDKTLRNVDSCDTLSGTLHVYDISIRPDSNQIPRRALPTPTPSDAQHTPTSPTRPVQGSYQIRTRPRLGPSQTPDPARASQTPKGPYDQMPYQTNARPSSSPDLY